MYEIPDRIIQLLDRGVIIPAPASVEVGSNVRPERIAPGVTHPSRQSHTWSRYVYWSRFRNRCRNTRRNR